MLSPASADTAALLLVEIGRSLLQYVAGCEPYFAPAQSEFKTTLRELATRQRHSAEQLSQLLERQEERIDFGLFPNEYCEYHFVAWDYLAPRVWQNQSLIVELCESAVTEAGPSETREWRHAAQAISERERAVLSGLRALCGTHAAPAV